ncbi:MAG TPA: SRPBCC family protein [Thermoanaerobaculia bacterium]
MNAHRYEPGPLADASATHADGQWTLVFPRELHHSPQQVWDVLTNPDALRAWSPFDADRNLGAIGPVTLTMAGGAADDPDTVSDATVRIADAPRTLEYTWGHDLLHWDLAPTSNGTQLTLHHRVEGKEWLAKVAAGWHICLDIADAYLSGNHIGRIVGQDAMEYWTPLNAAYEQMFLSGAAGS